MDAVKWRIYKIGKLWHCDDQFGLVMCSTSWNELWRFVWKASNAR